METNKPMSVAEVRMKSQDLANGLTDIVKTLTSLLVESQELVKDLKEKLEKHERPEKKK